MSCEAMQGLSVQLVLAGRLEFRELEHLREHLQTGCERCSDWLADTQQVALALSLLPEPVAPSADAKQRLFDRIENSEPSTEPALLALGSVTGSSRRMLPVAALSAAAAGILMAVFLGLEGARTADERDALRAQLALSLPRQMELEALLTEVRGELDLSYDEIGEVEAQIRELEDRVRTSARQIEMLRSPTVVVLSVAGTSRQPEARARAFWGEDYFCYLRVENIRDLPPGRTYALWLDTELEGVVLVGTFVADDGGDATLWVPIEGDLGKIARAFVTDESAGDVGPEPTGPAELESAAAS